MAEKYFNENEEMNAMEKAAQKHSVNAGLILFIIGFIMTLVGGLYCYNTDLHKYFKTMDYSSSYDASKAENISIELGSGDLNIIKTTDKQIKIDAKNVPEDFKAEMVGDTFTVKSTKVKSFWLAVPYLTSQNTRVDIYVPEKEYNKLFINSGAGDIRTADMKFKDVELKKGAGDYDIAKINCDTLKLTTGAGDNKFTDINCGSFSIEAGAGDLTIETLNCKGVMDIESGAGDLEISNAVTGGFKLDKGAGDATFNGTVNGDIKIDSGAGDLEINLTNPETDFGKKGKYTMTIDKGVGDKEVTYNN
ncbi:MAG: DUF4097 family beta strand repeat protein [Ruminococcus sp.]|nr:DUF4097 family beta strand repeat protein [Ruminococcus sp.]